MIHKKAISAIVGTSLLLLVTIISIIGFQSWFTTFSSYNLGNIEQTTNSHSLVIENIINNDLYLNNVDSSQTFISDIKINNVTCTLNLNIKQGINKINLSICDKNIPSGEKNILIFTKFGIFEKYVFIEHEIPKIYPKGSFVTIWDTTKISNSSSNQIKLPLEPTGDYNFVVNWGDKTNNTITNWNQSEIKHTYNLPGKYTVIISGIISGFTFDNKGDKNKILDVLQWGNYKANIIAANMFYGCENLDISAIDKFNMSGITNIGNIFRGTKSLTKGMDTFDISNVTSLYSVFRDSNFNGDLSSWNTSSITSLYLTFSNNYYFNRDISMWDTSSVTKFQRIFYNSTNFNQNLSIWNTSNGITNECFDCLAISWETQNKPILS